MLSPLLDLTITIHDARQDLRPAKVDPDDALSVQTARLPYWLDGDGREALSRLPGRAREGPRSARAPAEPARTERPYAAERPPRAQASPAVELAASPRHRAARARRAAGRLGDRRLPLFPRRGCEGERPPCQDSPGSRPRPV